MHTCRLFLFQLVHKMLDTFDAVVNIFINIFTVKTSHTAPGPYPQGLYSPPGIRDQKHEVLVKIQDIGEKKKRKENTQCLGFQLFSMTISKNISICLPITNILNNPQK